MKDKLLGTIAVAALAFGLQPAMAQDAVKIGFVSTLSGPQAIIGEDMRRSVDLAVEHLGGKMAGKKIEIVYEDDQFKPDVGKQKSEKLVQQDKVAVVAGYVVVTTLISASPAANRRKFSAISSQRRRTMPWVQPELCGVTMTFGSSWNGWREPRRSGSAALGYCHHTSSAAPPSRPSRNAA